MAKDNITYPSLIIIDKIFGSKITDNINEGSLISSQLVYNSPIGVEDGIILLQGIDYDIIEDTLIVY